MMAKSALLGAATQFVFFVSSRSYGAENQVEAGECRPEFAADTAASTVLCFEASVAFHRFRSSPAYRCARVSRRLDVGTTTSAGGRGVFFSSCLACVAGGLTGGRKMAGRS